MPVHVRFGRGMLASFQPLRACVVLADPGAVSETLAAQICKHWEAHGVEWIWQNKGECEMSGLANLAPTVWEALERSPQSVLIAIGGGSTLDMAKILRWRPSDTHGVLNMATLWRTQGRFEANSLVRHQLVCWPTTAGTGSEVSASATLWDRSAAVPAKLAWQPQHGFADQAWVDPELTLTCPPKVTRDCGLDALSHGLESLWNLRSSVLSQPLAMRAVALVIENLPKLQNDPANLNARVALSEASLLAGTAMSETQTALAHALSYDLTLHEGISHGLAVATWLPFVAQQACRSGAQMRQLLQQALGTQADPAEFLSTWLAQWGVVPRTLAHLPKGAQSLAEALASPRGRNQIIAL